MRINRDYDNDYGHYVLRVFMVVIIALTIAWLKGF